MIYVIRYMGMFPNVFGLANTAFLNTNNNTYALYERDKPYLIDIDKSHFLWIDVYNCCRAYKHWYLSLLKFQSYNFFLNFLTFFESNHIFYFILKFYFKMA